MNKPAEANESHGFLVALGKFVERYIPMKYWPAGAIGLLSGIGIHMGIDKYKDYSKNKNRDLSQAEQQAECLQSIPANRLISGTIARDPASPAEPIQAPSSQLR